MSVRIPDFAVHAHDLPSDSLSLWFKTIGYERWSFIVGIWFRRLGSCLYRMVRLSQQCHGFFHVIEGQSGKIFPTI